MTQYKLRASQDIIAEEFTGSSPGAAFDQCLAQKCTPAYMPELLRFKIAASAESQLWKQWYTSASAIITGRTKKGTSVVVFTHTQNQLNTSSKIKELITLGSRNGAGTLSTHEFYKMIEQQDNDKIFVVDYQTLYRSPSHEIDIHDALSHPFVIPFCGGRKYAEQYLKRYHDVTNQKTIMLRYGDDATIQPLARLLYLTPTGSFDGSASIESSNYLFGLKEDSLFSSRLKSNNTPSLEILLQLAQQYVPPIALKSYEAQLRLLCSSPQKSQEYSSDVPPPLPSRALPPPFPSSSSPSSTPSNSSLALAVLLQSPHPIYDPSPSSSPSLSTLHRLRMPGRPTTNLQLVEPKKR